MPCRLKRHREHPLGRQQERTCLDAIVYSKFPFTLVKSHFSRNVLLSQIEGFLTQTSGCGVLLDSPKKSPTTTFFRSQFSRRCLFVVWNLDRLGRRLKHLLETVEGLKNRGIGFKSIQEALDTSTPTEKTLLPCFLRSSRLYSPLVLYYKIVAFMLQLIKLLNTSCNAHELRIVWTRSQSSNSPSSGSQTKS